MKKIACLYFTLGTEVTYLVTWSRSLDIIFEMAVTFCRQTLQYKVKLSRMCLPVAAELDGVKKGMVGSWCHFGH